MIFGIKEKFIILTHTMAIATNIPQRLKTAFVVQGHIVKLCYLIYHSRRMPCNVLSENYVIKA